MPVLPSSIEDFRLALSDLRPGLSLKAEAPFHPGNGWWLDVEGLPLVYREGRGFGLFAGEDEEPQEWILAAAEAAQAVAGRLPGRHAA